MAWSSSDSASRTEPCAARAISASAGASKLTSSAARIGVSTSTISAGESCFRLNCRQRDRTVTGIFCGSVVASTNLTCAGGSSSVFSIELNAAFDSMCTSSIR